MLTIVGKFNSYVVISISVIDLPTKEHLSSFLRSQFFKTSNKAFDIVVHFSPKNVSKSHEYQRLKTNLTSKKHLFLNESNEYVASKFKYFEL